MAEESRILTQGRRILILFAALSYVFFFIEVYLGHYLWLQLFTQKSIFSFALIPQFFSPIALAVALWTAFRLTPTSVTAFRVTMVASVLVGLVGTYFHVVPRITTGASLLAASTWLGDPPLLAPAAFGLPGIIGLLATYGLMWEHVSPSEPLVAQKMPG